MTLLEHPNLIALGELAVRNSWEHLDERLDEVLHSGTCKSHSEIHVSVVPPEPHTFVNRNFDPLALSIKHGPDAVLLRPLLAESRDLSKRIGKAFLRLQTEAHDPY